MFSVVIEELYGSSAVVIPELEPFLSYETYRKENERQTVQRHSILWCLPLSMYPIYVDWIETVILTTILKDSRQSI